MGLRPLSLLETRVLGVLVEKSLTVPDSYPLSLNALAAGCNQKTARDPVLQVGEDELLLALDALKALDLAVESSGSRVPRYEHNFGRVFGLPGASVALLTALMLRGPQTTAELRTATERLHRFADHSAVEGFLAELAERAEEKGGPLVVRLPKAPGAREARWAHLLSGPIDEALMSHLGTATAFAGASDAVAVSELAAMRLRQESLERQVAELQSTVDRLCRELGITPGASE